MSTHVIEFELEIDAGSDSAAQILARHAASKGAEAMTFEGESDFIGKFTVDASPGRIVRKRPRTKKD